MIQFEAQSYQDEDMTCIGWLAYPKDLSQARPAILVIHDWSGCNEFAKDKAKQLAEQGYFGFAIDVYGLGRVASTIEEKQALMQPLLQDRKRLSQRILAAITHLLSQSQLKVQGIGAIGFCFGGLCALDLARTGEDIKAVVSFHGLLQAAPELPAKPIQAKVLVLHGYQDPLVPPEMVLTFAQEMQAKQASWQMHIYGQALHAFTNPMAHDTRNGLIYDEAVAHNAFGQMDIFFREAFACN